MAKSHKGQTPTRHRNALEHPLGLNLFIQQGLYHTQRRKGNDGKVCWCKMNWASSGLGNLADINGDKASNMPGILPRAANNLSTVQDCINMSFKKRKYQQTSQ